MQPPLVTIAIPTRNRANTYLPHALSAALAQTYDRIEIVVSDNGSTDATQAFVNSHNDGRIRYFRHQPPIGPNDNFNFCLSVAGGTYFLLLHDDDMIDADFVASCMKAADHNPYIGIIRTGTRVIDSKARVKAEALNLVGGASLEDFFLGWFENKTSFYFCSTLFNTQGLREIGGLKSKTNHYQDVVAAVKLAAKYGRVDVREIKATFRRHQHNMGSSLKIENWCEDCLYLLDIMCNLAPERQTLIRRRGMTYFCRQNYNRVRKYMPLMNHISSYLLVYRKFQYSYSPVHYMYSLILNRLKNAARRRLTKFVS